MWHIAGPFFNEAQRVVIQRIEEILAKNNQAFFSPMRSGIVEKDGSNAQDIFGKDVYMMNICHGAIVVIDWVLPEGQEIWLVNPAREGGHAPIHGPLNIPDAGTMFEVGYYYACGKPIVLFTLRDRGTEKMNVMITRAAEGVVYGYSHLDSWLSNGYPLADWEGKVQ